MSQHKTQQIKTRQRATNSPLAVLTREDGSKSRTIEGYAIVFNEASVPLWDDDEGRAVEVIAPGAVTRELLDASDIKMTMYHNREKILARSHNGEGTLSYEIDERGVKFRFDAPETPNGDEALALVERGDISGCSFAFSTRYFDDSCVSCDVSRDGDKTVETYTVRSILGIYDFTLAADPAYEQTEVSKRELYDDFKELREGADTKEQREAAEKKSAVARQVAAMREYSEKRL